LQIRLGGINAYQGRIDKKPFLGKEQRSFEPKLILDSVRLMLSSAWVTLVFCLAISFLIHRGMG